MKTLEEIKKASLPLGAGREEGKMKNLQTIKKILGRNKAALRKQYKVRDVAIFGSFAKGEQGVGSDLDLLVEFESPIGMFDFMDLEEHLQALLGIKVDLVTRNALKPNIGRSILEDLVPV